jgi:molybdenum cofactor cytidylyltransferase
MSSSQHSAPSNTAVRAVAAVLPAAGASRRMGRAKLLLPWNDTTVAGATAAALRTGGAGRIVLVVAPGDEALRAWGESAGIEVAVNPEPARGMLSTIVEGIAALGGASALAARNEILLVCPADLPALAPSSVTAVLDEMEQTRAPLAVPVHGDRRGHPLAIASALVAEIPDLDPDVGLRQLLDRHAERVLKVVVEDPGILLDVDTPEDYRALTGELE